MSNPTNSSQRSNQLEEKQTMTQKLVAYLEQCDKAYYVEGNPLVSNETYEALVRSLAIQDPTNPYLQKVGTKYQGKGRKVGRLIPMGTLGKLNKDEEIQDWLEDGVQYIVGPKYDGFACELNYVDGKLVMGSSRGDGIVGEDITASAKICPNVPHKVPSGLTSVRGEFIIPKKHHQALKDAGYTAMRNAVPGIVRSGNELMKYVEFIAYRFIDGRDDRLQQYEAYQDFFQIEHVLACTDKFEEIRQVRQNFIDGERDAYEYEIDGLVLKTVEIREDDLRHPQFEVSWKFKSNREATKLKGVRVQMGVTGKFSPVGDFEPVEFQGARLTQASLGSYGRLKKMMEDENAPIKIGSIVEVSRRGDIIPYIEEVTYTPDDALALAPLTHCPHCEHPVEFRGEEPYCVNDSCPKLLDLRVGQYVANTGMKGIGGSTITRLCGWQINSLADIYKMNAEVIAELPRLGQSAVDKWKELQSKELTTLQFALCLPFDGIGPAVWEQLLAKMTFREILDLDEETILAMELKRFGEGKRKDFIEQKDALKSTIEELLNYVPVK